MKKKNKSNISKYKKTDLSRCLLFIEPGPVVLVSSYNLETKQPNLMTISWTIALDFNHHIALCTGPWNYSFDLIMKTKECVVAIPPASMAETVIKIGDISGKDCDKFEKFGIKQLEAEKTDAPLIDGCVANLECKVVDFVKKYGLIILEVVNVWENEELKDEKLFHAYGDGKFVKDGEKMDLRKFMADKIPEGL